MLGTHLRLSLSWRTIDSHCSHTLQILYTLSREAFLYPLVVVVNALDECGNNDDVSLLIRCLAAAVAVQHVDPGIFVTSRPDQPISLGFDRIAAEAHQDFILHDIEQ